MLKICFSFRYAATISSTIFVYIVMWIYLGISDSSECIGEFDAYIFRNAALICLGVGGFSSLIFHVSIKGTSSTHLVGNRKPTNLEHDNDLQVKVEGDEIVKDISIKEVSRRQPMRIKDWFYEPQFYIIGCLYMFTRLFVNSTQVFMPFYLQITLQLKALYISVIPLTMYLSGLPCAFIVKFVTKRFGKKLSYAIACVIGGAGCFWVHWGMLLMSFLSVRCN